MTTDALLVGSGNGSQMAKRERERWSETGDTKEEERGDEREGGGGERREDRTDGGKETGRDEIKR